MNILVIAAHPDDEILGMGGTIKKFTKKGHKVKIVIMATGIEARRSTNFENQDKYEISDKEKSVIKNQIIKIRSHSRKAVKLLGVNDIEFLDFPDNEMDKISNLQITKVIESLINKFKPSKIFTHSPHDINIDHRLIYQAVITATRPNSKQIVDEVYSFEIPSSTEWFFPTSFQPNVFVDISKELKIKLKSMKEYKTEIKKFPHPRSIKALEHISKKWGSVAGYGAAEVFYLVRQLKKDFN
jgi:LmbE family N-acetylglucosaminyl deacetylase